MILNLSSIFLTVSILLFPIQVVLFYKIRNYTRENYPTNKVNTKEYSFWGYLKLDKMKKNYGINIQNDIRLLARTRIYNILVGLIYFLFFGGFLLFLTSIYLSRISNLN